MCMKAMAALIAPLIFAGAAFAHDDGDGSGLGAKQLGSVKFQNSCSPKVQARVTRGVAMLHSFWWPAGQNMFQEIAAEDPNCAIAAWGFASILMYNPFAAVVPPADVERAQGAIA